MILKACCYTCLMISTAALFVLQDHFVWLSGSLQRVRREQWQWTHIIWCKCARQSIAFKAFISSLVALCTWWHADTIWCWPVKHPVVNVETLILYTFLSHPAFLCCQMAPDWTCHVRKTFRKNILYWSVLTCYDNVGNIYNSILIKDIII